MKIEVNIKICTNFVTIGYVNKTIGQVNEAIQYVKLEGTNEIIMGADKDKKLQVCMTLRENKIL